MRGYSAKELSVDGHSEPSFGFSKLAVRNHVNPASCFNVAAHRSGASLPRQILSDFNCDRLCGYYLVD
jgi:hypothetical protein